MTATVQDSDRTNVLASYTSLQTRPADDGNVSV